MQKLLDTYRTDRTLKNTQKVRAYERKHPMVVCLYSGADADLIADAIYHANRG